MEKKKKYDNIYVDYSFSLIDKEHGDIITPEMWTLLKHIDADGSISAAATSMKISYRKAWDMVKSCESSLGICILNKIRGGINGGKTILSPEGEKLMSAYDNLIVNVESAFEEYIVCFKRTLKGKSD
jgi:molybdate transport system regulatory protein